jgi:hypothetical protein
VPVPGVDLLVAGQRLGQRPAAVRGGDPGQVGQVLAPVPVAAVSLAGHPVRLRGQRQRVGVPGRGFGQQGRRHHGRDQHLEVVDLAGLGEQLVDHGLGLGQPAPPD